MHLARIHLLALLIYSASAFHHEKDEVWDYEPNEWSYESAPGSDEDGPELDPFPGESETQATSQDDEFTPSLVPDENHRSKNYFLRSNRDFIERQSSRPCTQFRVDTREAIICDKQRCDKLDFQLPTYDNQLVLIQTTRHGMRFHREDLAFARGTRRSSPEKSSDEKKKIDIFELFKPKPTTSTTLAPTESSTVPPDDGQQTSTTPSDASTTTTTQATPETSNSRDANKTQLVTTFRLDTRRRRQSMIGFGGALTDSTCRNIKSLSPEMAKNLMEDYFGERGLRYNIARLSVGSSDFSTTPYTNNDPTNSSGTRMADSDDEYKDLEMKNFRLTQEDYDFKLPVVRQAIATSAREIKLFASLWSPPVWMKNNSHIVHGYLKGDVYGPYYRALAELMLKWLEAYRENGITFWGFTGLNEPVTGIKPFIFHNSLGITKDDYKTFIKLYLGPMLERRGFKDVKLMIVDDNKGYLPNWVKSVLGDQQISKFVSGIGVHWYMNDEYENLNFIPRQFPDKFILGTEACNGYLPFQVHAMPGDWHRGVAYMYEMTRLIQKSAAGWVDWNMALDLTGGPSWARNNLDAPIIVNAKRDEYYKSPMFYAMGHFSRFVEPNSTRLDYRMGNARYDYPLEAVGFLTPQSYIVIVALNANGHSVPFRVIVDGRLVRVVTLRGESFNTIIFKWGPS